MKLRILSASLLLAAIAPAFTACYEDKGNYEYSEKEEIGINPEELTVSAMQNTEHIVITPRITSSMVGEITDGNPDYKFECSINSTHKDENGKEQRWLLLNPDGSKDVDYPANVGPGTYICWYRVTNLKTGIQYNARGSVRIISTTYEGWMVLSNNGADRKARLDIIFADSKGVERVSKDLLDDKCPAISDATALIMCPTKMSVGDRIFLLSTSGGYQLNAATLQARESENIKNFDFMVSNTPGEVVNWRGIFNGYAGGPQGQVCVTSEGNAYGVHVFGAGACFEYPMNTDKPGNDPTYKVSPLIGTTMVRPAASNCALFYDETNRRFMGYDYSFEGDQRKLLFTLTDPAKPLFSFKTGKKLVAMESTSFSGGLVYAVLESDAGVRDIAGINMAGAKVNNCFVQECYYPSISATDFRRATSFAFHSQYPLVFYCAGSKVYGYNLATGQITQTIDLPGETVTKVKFNLFQCNNLDWLADHSDEFLAQQYDLIVASHTGGEDSGIVRFYTVNRDGTLTVKKEFTGLGENIVDVTYRERK